MHTRTVALAVLSAILIGVLGACRVWRPVHRSGVDMGTPVIPVLPPSPTTYASSAATAYPAPPTGYPAPPTAVTLHPAIGGMPPGAVVRQGERQVLAGGDAEHAIDAVPLTGVDGGMDMAIVVSDANSSRVAWRLRQDGDETIGRPKAIHLQPMQERADQVGILVTAAGTPAGAQTLVVLAYDKAHHFTPMADLPTESLPAGYLDHALVVQMMDVTGDGRPDALLYAASVPSAVFFHSRPGGRMLQVSELQPRVQLMDTDGDDVFEQVVFLGDGKFKILKWSGSEYLPAGPPEPETTTPIQAASADVLPPLPAPLYFMRQNALWRWPVAGGQVERIAAGLAEPGSQPLPFRGKRDDHGLPIDAPPGFPALGPYRLAPDGKHLAYVRARPETESSARQSEVVVLDVTTGVSVTLPVPYDQLYGDADIFELTADGRWVVLMAPRGSRRKGRQSPGLASGDARPSTYNGGYGEDADILALDTANPGAVRQVAYCGGSRDDGDGSVSGCMGMRLSPDGRQVAFADALGLWVTPMDGGMLRLLTTNESEGMPWGRNGIHSPDSWSPDGRYLISTVQYYEGGGSVLWDVATGQGTAIPGAFEYAGPSYELSWTPDSRILFARSGSPSELVLINPADMSLAEPIMQHVDLFDLEDQNDEDTGYLPFSPHALADGSVLFGMRSTSHARFRANGVYRVRADHFAWQPIVTFPPMNVADVPDDTKPLAEIPWGEIRWAHDGIAFLIVTDANYGGTAHMIVGLGDGGPLRDVSAALSGATEIEWGR